MLVQGQGGRRKDVEHLRRARTMSADRAAASVTIAEVPRESRRSLLPILDQSFTGIYRWHAQRTLRSVRWVRAASQDGQQVGLAMSSMLGGRVGYVYYIAVSPSQRATGIGGLLMDDALETLRAAGATEALACVRPENIASVRLLLSRNFTRTGFGALVRSTGFAKATVLWRRMVVAPGERVYRGVVY
jgi:ribosomal protein S18 acetylase RimI-like enzyme